MEKIKIKGKVTFQNLGTGFWGIIDEQDQKWRPTNLPESMQEEGLEVNLIAEETKQQMSIFMWGKAVQIIEP